MRANRLLIVFVFFIALSAEARDPQPRFIDLTAVDVIALLPSPPVAGSLQAAAEMDAVLRAQNSRSETDAKRAKSENKLTPVAFQSVLGPDFTAEKYPLVYELLKDAELDSKFFTSKGKGYFGRPRPKDVESRVQPAVKSDNDRAYPSGHATRGMLWAIILGEIAPDQKKALLARGQEIGWDRVLAGVHYPSDVYAGEVLGQALAQSMLSSERFRARLQNAKQEYELSKRDAARRAYLQRSHDIGTSATKVGDSKSIRGVSTEIRQ